MNSELIAEAMFAENQRAYRSSRWQREWRRLTAAGTYDAPTAALPAARAEDPVRQCPAPEARIAAGR